MAERVPRLSGSYVLLPVAEGGDMVWPNPLDPGELQYRLRYGPPLTKGELLVAASHLEAYRYLICELPQRTRNKRVSEIRTALNG